MNIQAFRTKLFKEGHDLISFIKKEIKIIPDKSILVVTSKIVALSENRTVVIEDEFTREKVIKSESDFAMRTKYTWLTIKDGMVLASAGVDESNADGKIILLPKDSFKSASQIRLTLMKYYKIKNLGIIISDSRLLPLRAGVVGIALGYAGFKGIRDYRGSKDLFGRKLKFSQTDVVDSLATAAVLLMGEGNECQPLALITNPPIVFTEKINKKELLIDPKEDVYQPLFEKIKKIKF
jgi:coenzyme F420-0:L-glutamate ligase